ncbi:hypothetical protein BD779DRAFT_1691760, partial [Infundibulicybe gibba]
PENACETLYIQNLNEKIKPEVLKASLRGLFKSYGEVLDVVAHGNLRMRGQAFVSFASPDIAKKAMKDVQRFPLYSKPMQISFARTRSDAVVRKIDANNYDEHKTRRDEHKRKTRYTNPLKQKFRAKRMAQQSMGSCRGPVQAAKCPNAGRIPPSKQNSILAKSPRKHHKGSTPGIIPPVPKFIRSPSYSYQKGHRFVEFIDEGSAGVAKDALHNYKLDGENKIKV